METCYQCRGNTVELQPVVVLVPTKDLPAEDTSFIIEKGLGANNEEWAAMPMCTSCHQQPTVKGHFFYRQQMTVAIRSAGSSHLGG